MMTIIEPNTLFAYSIDSDIDVLEHTVNVKKKDLSCLRLPNERFDVRHACIEHIVTTNNYRDMCKRLSLYTKTGSYYRSRMQDIAFFLKLGEQQHTAMSDVKLMQSILLELWRRNKNTEITLSSAQIWRKILKNSR